jgi:tripartite-type tricarboxylate transporter receptor subunit TctC
LPEVDAQLRELGAQPAPSGPDQFSDFLKAERVKWREVVAASGARID